MDLVKFVRILLKRKLLLIIVPLFSITVSYILLRNSPDSFKSKAQLATGITDEFKTSIEDSDSRKPYVVENKFSNLVQLIKSASVINLVSYSLMIHDLTMDKPFRKDGKLLSEINSRERMQAYETYKSKYDSLHSLTAMDDTEKILLRILEEQKYDYKNILEGLKVYRLETSDFIELVFESENPTLSAFVVNTICEEFIRYYKTVSGEKSSNSVNFFAKLAAQKKDELDKKVEELKNYKLKNGIINLYEQTEAIVDQIARVEIMRETDNKRIEALRKAIKVIDERLSGRDQQYVEADMRPFNKEIVKLKDQIQKIKNKVIQGELKEDEAELLLNSVKEKLNKQVFTLTDEIVIDPNVSMQQLINKKLSYLLDLEIIQKSVISIDKELQRLYKVAQGFAPSEALVSSYEREITVAEEVYLLMLNKLNTATLNSLDLAGSLKQIERGEPAEKPEASKKMLLMILAGMVSFVFTVVVIFALEYLDLTVRSPLEFSLRVKLKLLGTLNKVSREKLNMSLAFENKDNSVDVSIFKQLIRQLRHVIKTNMVSDKILLFSSTKKGTGKSFLISTLAYAFARAGKRILIIDANFYNCSLTEIFDVTPTLQPYLLNEIDNSGLVQHTKIEGVDIIGSELSHQSPFELDTGEKFNGVLQQLGENYDYIFIEGPSLNKYSDTKELLDKVHKIVTVFSAQNVIEESDKNSINFIKNLGDKNMGAILNSVALENIEPVYGEIEKHRTKFRQIIKRYLNRNFGKSEKSNKMDIAV